MVILKDRVPTKPNRKKITFEDDSSVRYATVEYADEPVEAGTAVNKQNVIDTAKLIYEIGDIKVSGRDLTSDGKYLQCNGSTVLAANYPDLTTALGTKYGVPLGDWVSRTNSSQWGAQDLRVANGIFFWLSTLLMKSTDGISWTDAAWGGGSFNNGGIAYGNNKYVAFSALANCYIRHSTNLTSWAFTSVPSFSAKDIAFGNGIFVIVGFSGKVYTSTDAITWTSRTSGTTGALQRVVFGNGAFIAIAVDGSVMIRSIDGINWTIVSAGFTPNQYKTLCFGNKFIMYVSSTQMAVSSDGATWSLLSHNLGSVAVAKVLYDTVKQCYLWLGTTTSYISKDGLKWFAIASTTVSSVGNGAFYNGVVVAIPTPASTTFYTNTVLTDRAYLPNDSTNTMWIRAVE